MFYKIINNQTGTSLFEMLPQYNAARTGRILRNAENCTVYQTRTSTYKRSFFPSITQLWNNLTVETRNARSVTTFRRKLYPNLERMPKHYYYGKSNPARYHCRLRNKCSNLNQHLFQNHIVLNPLCSCGAGVEDVEHFFFACSKYRAQRIILTTELQKIDVDFIVENLNILLFGEESLNYELNKKIFKLVQQFIFNSKRFR